MKIIKKILTLIFVAIWLIFILFGVPTIIELGYEQYFGKDTPFLLASDATIIPVVLGIVVMAVLLWLFSPDGIYLGYDEPREKANFPLKTKLIIAGISLVVMVFGIVASTFWYDNFSIDGVECRHLFLKEEYTWTDVEYVTLESDWHGVLMFVMHMEDGTKHHFNGGTIRAVEYSSEAFDEKFPDGTYDYMVWLGEKLSSYNVELQIEDKEKLLSDLDYESWRDLAKEVINVWEK